MIALKDVSVRVPESGGGEGTRALLSHINLSLQAKRIAIIGANGSGKSTLLQLLNGLILPSSGQVLVNGQGTEQGKAREQVGFIFTDPLAQLIMPTPVEDIELSLRKTIKSKAARRERALEILRGYGLEKQAFQSIYDLSGGERQLVALGAVLAVNPRILVADEPTTLLDLRNKLRLFNVFASLEQQIIYATHDLEFAAQAEQMVVITGGETGFVGQPEPAIEYYVELSRAATLGEPGQNVAGPAQMGRLS